MNLKFCYLDHGVFNFFSRSTIRSLLGWVDYWCKSTAYNLNSMHIFFFIQYFSCESTIWGPNLMKNSPLPRNSFPKIILVVAGGLIFFLIIILISVIKFHWDWIILTDVSSESEICQNWNFRLTSLPNHLCKDGSQNISVSLNLNKIRN